MARQLDLFGGSTDLPPDVIARMSRNDKIRYLLETYPETRGNDCECILRWWEVFDGLRGHLGDDGFEAFADAFRHVYSITCTETIRRGRAEVQKLRTGSGSLLPSQSVVEYRKSRDGAGAPGPRG